MSSRTPRQSPDRGNTSGKGSPQPKAPSVAALAVTTISTSPSRRLQPLPHGPEAGEDEMQRAVTHQALARDYLPRLFHNDPTLSALELSDTACSDVALIALTDALKGNAHIAHLDLDSNSITDEGARLLGDALAVNASLRTLSLRNNNVGSRGAQFLIAALELNAQLVECDVSGNDFIDEESLKELNILTNLNAKPRALKRVILNLKRDVAGEVLNLSRSEKARAEFRELGHDEREHLDDWAAETLAFYLASNRTVTHVDLSFHHIGDTGAWHLSQMLKLNRHIDKLNLQGNMISCVGAEYFVDALRINNACRFVCLLKNSAVSQQNIIRLEWAAVLNRQPLALKPLIKPMEENDPTLIEVILDVSDSQRYFDDITARLVSDALRNNTHVSKLQISNSRISHIGCRFLGGFLSTSLSNALRVIDFSGNPLGNPGCAQIVSSLLLNRTVVTLALRHVDLGDVGAVSIAELLRENDTLTELDISDNMQLTQVGGAKIVGALNSNNTLVELNVSGTNVGPTITDDIEDRKKLNSEPPQVRTTISQLYSTSSPAKAVRLCGKRESRRLQDASMRLVAEGIESNFTATVIDVSHNQLTILGIAALMMALFENKNTAVEVNISYNTVADPMELARMVSRLLQTHQTLRRLDLSGMGLTDPAVNRIAQALDSEQTFPIQSVVIDDNPNVSDSVAFNLHVLVKLNTLQVRLKDVLRPFWTRCKICAEEKRDFPISHVDFRNYSPLVVDEEEGAQQADTNRIDEGALLVCDILRRVEGNVTSLDYSENELSDAGACHFADLLLDQSPRNRCRLVRLNLERNRLTDKSVQRLKTAAESSRQLLELSVCGNHSVSANLLEALQRTVLYNRQPPLLQEMLVLISNNDPSLTSLVLTPAAADVVPSSTLTEGVGQGNGNTLDIGDDQILLISEGLQRNSVISVIDVSHCHITWKSVGTLLHVVLANMASGKMCGMERLVLRNLMLSEEDSEPLCRSVRDILIENQRQASSSGGTAYRPLRHVDIGCNVIAASDVPLIVEGLSAHKGLEFFGVGNSGLSETDMLRVQLSVPKNKPQQEDVRDVVALARGCDPSFTELISTGKELNSILAVDVCEALTAAAISCHSSFLTYLDISENDLSDQSTANCFAALAENTVLQDLRMCRNHVGPATIDSLILFLQRNCSLLYLDIRQNTEITLDSLRKLRDQAIHCNHTLRQIFISDEDDLRAFSEIRRKQMEGIISTLPPLLPLTRRPSTAHSIAPTIQTVAQEAEPTRGVAIGSGASNLDCDLTELQLLTKYFVEELTLNQQCFIKKVLPQLRADDPFVVSICRPHHNAPQAQSNSAAVVLSSCNNETVVHPFQCVNEFGLHNDIGCEHIAEALLYNTHVTELDLSMGLVTDRGCAAIARALMVNRSLTSLNLAHNSIGDSGVMMLADVFQVNPVIRFVDVSMSKRPISASSLDRLRVVLTQNDSVRSLDVAPLTQSKPTSAGSAAARLSRATSAVSTQSRSEAQKEFVASESRLRLVSTLNSIHLGLKQFLRHDSDGHVTREIDCSNAVQQQDGRRFGREACRVLCCALSADQCITHVNLSDNQLDNESAQMIATLLESNVSITSLDLSGNPLISDGANVLHDALIKNHSVVSMKLERCSCATLILEKVQLLLNLNREHIAMKQEILQLQKKVEAHTLCRVNVPELFPIDVVGYPGIANRKQQLDDESMEIVAQVLRADVIVTSLDFSWNSIGDSGFHTLLLLLKRNKGISSIQLAHNVVTDESMKQLRFMIAQLPALSLLDLSYNLITTDSVSVIIQTLRKSPTLHRILLDGNRIAPRERDTISFFGILNEKCSPELRLMLTDAIDNTPSMTTMDMSSFYSCGNWLADGTTVQLLSFALLSNTAVTTLDLEFNDIDNKQFQSLCHLFQTNRTITNVNLANNHIDNIDYFVDKNGFGIEKLSLRKNRLGITAARALAHFLRRNTTLQRLDVSQNLWGRAGVSMINEALPMNDGLKEIDVRGDGVPLDMEERAEYALTLNYRAVILPCE